VTTNCDCRTPAWTPDGKRILFSARYGGNPDVFSIGADGAGLRALLRTPASEVEVGTAR
jgi:Tol biopolymer transport system component